MVVCKILTLHELPLYLPTTDTGTETVTVPPNPIVSISNLGLHC